jgi:4-hydroxy-3-methylbut-2-enyl diphosphate reductase
MDVIKGDLRGKKGIPKNGLCIGVHRAGTMHKRLANKLNKPLTVWSLRPDNEFLAYQRDELGEKDIRATGELDDVEGEVIFGVRGAPPQVREKARAQGLEVLADATCPYVVEQEEAAVEFLEKGLNLVMLSDPNHHGIPRIKGIAEKLGRPFFIVENVADIAKINLTRQEPIGVIVQTTFWLETYKEIMAVLLERFADVHVRNTACIDSLQRLPVVAELARDTDGVVIVGWTEGMTTRMVETARACSDHVHAVRSPDEIEAGWFEGLEKVGVIGANETPDWMVDEAIERIKSLTTA